MVSLLLDSYLGYIFTEPNCDISFVTIYKVWQKKYTAYIVQLVPLSDLVSSTNIIAITAPTITTIEFLNVDFSIMLIKHYNEGTRGSYFLFFVKCEEVEQEDLNKIESNACPCLEFNNKLVCRQKYYRNIHAALKCLYGLDERTYISI